MRKPYVNFRELKAAVPIVKVLERYGLLENLKGRGEALAGPCPLCEGNTSFRANADKNCFHCFSCKAGGNMLDLVAAMEDCQVRDAAVKVAEWFGIETSRPGRQASNRRSAAGAAKTKGAERESPKQAATDEGSRVEEAKVSAAANPAQAQPPSRHTPGAPLTFELKLDPDHPWIAEAGLTPETVSKFGIGFCSRGMMAGRICFPIRNGRGELMGYAGRWPGDDPPEGEPFWRFPKGLDLSSLVYPAEKLAATPPGSELLAGDPLRVVFCRQQGIDAYFVPGGTGLAKCVAALLKARV